MVLRTGPHILHSPHTFGPGWKTIGWKLRVAGRRALDHRASVSGRHRHRAGPETEMDRLDHHIQSQEDNDKGTCWVVFLMELCLFYWNIFQCITLVIMLVEAITVLIRQSTHFRVTRSLRPIFLVDTRACGSVRRYLRQILQSLPPILDMLILILFIVCCYALLGYFLFGNNPKNLYFQTLGDSFVSMFVLLTTAK